MVDVTQCPIRTSLSVIGKKWSIEIIYELMFSAKRFGELLERLEGISSRTLNERLIELERNEIIVKIVLARTPITTVYKLDDKSFRLRNFLIELALFSIQKYPTELLVTGFDQDQALLTFINSLNLPSDLLNHYSEKYNLPEFHNEVILISDPVLFSLKKLRNKWIIEILTDMTVGINRFSQFKEMNPKLSSTVLSDRLKYLEEEGIIEKKLVSMTPLQTEYSFSEYEVNIRSILYELSMFCGLTYPEKILSETEVSYSEIADTMGNLFRLPKDKLVFNREFASFSYQPLIQKLEIH